MNYKLLQGDCIEQMKTIKSGSVDAIITDPPYGTTACKWDSVIDFDLMWEQLNRIIKPNGAIVLFGSEPFSSALRMSNIKNYKYDWVWQKSNLTGHLNAKKQPLRCIENICIFYKNSANYNPQMVKGDPYDKGVCSNKTENYGKQTSVNSKNKNGDRYPKNIISIKNVHRANSVHPTQKPVLLMEYLIKTYTNENETVLDFTMGSGSTGVACVNTNRNFIGIERDNKYFEIATNRIKENEYNLFNV
jgi:DNA modification methylase